MNTVHWRQHPQKHCWIGSPFRVLRGREGVVVGHNTRRVRSLPDPCIHALRPGYHYATLLHARLPCPFMLGLASRGSDLYTAASRFSRPITCPLPPDIYIYM